MPSRIDQNLIPPVIRDSVDPDILNRAQSIEWSINRDTGEDEHGFLDGSHEDYLTSQNLMPKTHGSIHFNDKSRLKQLEWSTTDPTSGRDSGYDQTPVSPSLNKQQQQQLQQRSSTRSVSSLATGGGNNNYVDLSPLDDFSASNTTNTTGLMKQHPASNRGLSPYPIYKVNQDQLRGDVFFEVAPQARPGERTVHYEKSSRVMDEQEMNALGLDPNVFTPNSRTTMDEQEEELIETSVLKGGARELEDIYNSMRGEAGDYFERQRARSVSPVGNRQPINDEESSERRITNFGSMGELDTREQEFYPYRDAHQGKPLPGDNEYGTWGSRFDEKRQWKLCNGQWVRIAPKPPAKPEAEKYMAERIKCKPPRKMGPLRSEPIRTSEPQGSTDSELDSDDHDEPLEQQPAVELVNRRLPRRVSLEPPLDRDRYRSRPVPRVDLEPPVDLDALRDKYRPKVAEKASIPDDDDDALTPTDDDDDEVDTKANSAAPTGTILLEPIQPPPQEIVKEPIQPLYVEMKKPLKQPEGEEEKMMEDPNLMWMHIGPAQYGPPFGTLKRRKAREEEWVGPPCELCHKQIEERRCMLAENMKFHCWHFACSFCLKTLKPADFLIAEMDRKPYCLNCHKREFPEISLVNLKLEES